MKPAALVPVLGFALLILLALAGWFHTTIAPDTASYLAATTAADPLGASRLPLYGWAAGWLLRHAAPLVAWIQAAIFLAGGAVFVASLQRTGLSRPGAWAVAIAIATSTLLLLWTRDAVPEVAGHGFLFAGLAASLLAIAGSWLWIFPASLAVTLAWALVPGLLAFAVLPAALPWLLPHRAGRGRLATCLLLLVALAAPATGLIAWRGVHEGSPSVVSYGGFTMSGIGGLMLTPALVAKLPAAQRGEATAILANRELLDATGRAIPVPANSTGVRSFTSAALLYFDLMARTYDDVVFFAVRPTRHQGESWPHFDRRLQRLTIAIVRATPRDYAAWVGGATARLVGHALVLNPSFVLAFLVLIVAWLSRGPVPPSPDAVNDNAILLAITGLWVLGTAAPVVLITFPAERYIDSAAILLAAWPIAAVLRRLSTGGRGRDKGSS